MTTIPVPYAVDVTLRRVRRRTRTLRALDGLMLTLAVAIATLLLALGIDAWLILFSTIARTILTVTTLATALITLTVCLLKPVLHRQPRSHVARTIEATHPELEERWSTIAELAASRDPDAIRGDAGLIQQVADEALALQSTIRTERIAAPPRLRYSAVGLGCAAALLAIVVLAWPAEARVLLRRFCAPTRLISMTQIDDHTAKHVVARGESFPLDADVTGRLPDTAELLLRDAHGRRSVDFALDRDAPTLHHVIPAVDESFEYAFRAGDGQTTWAKVIAADRPSLARAHYRITPPAYSKLPVQEDDSLPLRVRALQGSTLELTLTPTHSLASLRLETEDGPSHTLIATSENYHFRTTLDRSIALIPRLTDTLGLTNLAPPTCRIQVYEDRPPTVRITSPARELAVNPNEKVRIAFEARDDVGVASAELLVAIDRGADQPPEIRSIPIPLGDKTGERTLRAQTELDLAALKPRHGDRINYAVKVYDTRQASALEERNASMQPVRQTNAAERLADAHDDRLAASASQPAGANDSAASQPASADDTPNATSQPAQAQTNASSPTSQPDRHATATSPSSQSALARAPQSQPTHANASPNESRSNPASSPAQTDASRPRASTPRDASNNASQPSSNKEASSSQPDSDRPNPDIARRPAPQQGAMSQEQKIQVDKWAGDLQSQQREKLRIDVDEYIRRLDTSLASSQKQIGLAQHPTATAPADTSLAAARTDLAGAADIVSELKSRSADTPYAFMGLQLHDIRLAHITPARRHLSAVATRPAADAANVPDIEEANYHVVRARERLADLTRKYEEVKRQERVQEATQRLTKMHQILIEDTLKLLESEEPPLNPRPRRMFEIDDQIAAAMKEFLEESKKIEADFAKALADRPDLLRRYLDGRKSHTTNLRDELSKLHLRQHALSLQVAVASQPATDTQPTGREALLTAATTELARQQQLLAENLATSQERITTWRPPGSPPAWIQADANAAQSAKLLHDAANRAGERNLDETLAIGTKAVELLESAHTQLLSVPPPPTTRPVNLAARFVARRTAELERLIARQNALLRRVEAVRDGRFGKALGLEQAEIKAGSADLAERIVRKLPPLEQISKTAVRQLQQAAELLDGPIARSQQESGIAIRAERWALATPHARNADENLQKAEDLMDRALTQIELALLELAKQRPAMPPGPPVPLEALLKSLEDEQDQLEVIGARPPEMNINVITDWEQKGKGQNSGEDPKDKPKQGRPGEQANQKSTEPPMPSESRTPEQQAQAARRAAERARAEAARNVAAETQGKSGKAFEAARQSREKILAELRERLAKRPANKRPTAPHESNGATSNGGREFNTLASELSGDITQSRGTNPPAQYRQAIENYLETIARQGDSPVSEPAP